LRNDWRVAWSRVGSWLNRWATRSLAVGAVAAAFDWSTAATLLWAQVPTRVATMTGATLGATVSYLGNRFFAFQDIDRHSNSSLLRYATVVAVLIAIHGQTVVALTCVGFAFPAAKLTADMTVFNLAQLLLLRKFVFPPAPTAPRP
jgi:putative flippase GtrA